MSYASKLKTIAKEKRKKEKFIKTRMWTSTAMSTLFPDSRRIPKNLGNNVLILNNMYVTKNSMNRIILITDISDLTPINFTSDVIKNIKSNVEEALPVSVDYTIKLTNYEMNATESGMQSRRYMWEKEIDNPNLPEDEARLIARQLFTYDLAVDGLKTYRGIFFVTVRASNSTELDAGIDLVCRQLKSYKVKYKVIKSNIGNVLKRILMMSNKESSTLKGIDYCIFSNETLAQVLPNVQGFNSDEGVPLGIDVESNTVYREDFRNITAAKNIVLVGLSGFGKTFLMQTWLPEFYLDNYNICANDIKNNELTAITRIVSGITFDLTQTSQMYINSFRLVKPEFPIDYAKYFDKNFQISVEWLTILTGIEGERKNRVTSLLSEFLSATYKLLGVSASNPNTWYLTDNLNAYEIYHRLTNYINDEVRSVYSDVVDDVLNRLRSRIKQGEPGAMSFSKPFDLGDMLDRRMINFAFGSAVSSGEYDPILFKVRFFFMRIIKEDYIAHKFSKGEYTVLIDEEVQICSEYVLEEYSKDFTVRRAMNCISIALLNSITTVKDKVEARGLIDTANIFCLGMMNESSKDYLINEFGLDKYAKDLNRICDNPKFDKHFLLINKANPKSTVGMLRAYLPDKVAGGEMFAKE